MGLVAAIMRRLGYAPILRAAPRKAAGGSSVIANLTPKAPWGVAHPGKTTNDLEYSWRHPMLFSCYHAIASAAMGVPLKVMQFVPTEEAKAQRRWITSSHTKHLRYLHGSTSAPVFLKAMDDRGVQLEEVDDGHPLRELLNKVNRRTTWKHLSYETAFDMKAAGNAYWELVGGETGGPPSELWRLRPDRVKVDPDPVEVIKGYWHEIGGKRTHLTDQQVLHFRIPHPMNDYYGLAAAEVLEKTLKTDWGRLEYAEALFEHGAQLGGYLQPLFPQADMDPDMAKAHIEKFKDEHTGVANWHQVALSLGMKFEPTQLTPRDADYLRMGDRHDTEISAVTGVPTPKFKPKDVNRSNLEAAELQFWGDTMVPLLSLRDADINEFLAPRYGDNVLVESDFTGVQALAVDNTNIIDRETRVFATGATSIDELRAAAGYDALPDGAGQKYLRKMTDTFVTLEEDNAPEPEPEVPHEQEQVQPTEEAEQPQAEEVAPEEEALPAKAAALVNAILRKQTMLLPMEYGGPEHVKAATAWEKRLQKHEAPVVAWVDKWGAGLERDLLAKLDGQKAFKATVPDPKTLLFDPEAEADKLWSEIEQAAEGALREAGAETLAEMGIDIIFDTENPLVTEYVKAKELLVKRVATDLHEDLRKILVRDISEGTPVETLRANLQTRFSSLRDWQARNIAQTEMGGALNTGSFAAIDQVDGRKSWLATLDGVVRPTHAAAMKEGTIPVQQKFAANGMLHPGDPAGGPGETCQCRCALVAYPAE